MTEVSVETKEAQIEAVTYSTFNAERLQAEYSLPGLPSGISTEEVYNCAVRAVDLACRQLGIKPCRDEVHAGYHMLCEAAQGLKDSIIQGSSLALDPNLRGEDVQIPPFHVFIQFYRMLEQAPRSIDELRFQHRLAEFSADFFYGNILKILFNHGLDYWQNDSGLLIWEIPCPQSVWSVFLSRGDLFGRGDVLRPDLQTLMVVGNTFRMGKENGLAAATSIYVRIEEAYFETINNGNGVGFSKQVVPRNGDRPVSFCRPVNSKLSVNKAVEELEKLGLSGGVIASALQITSKYLYAVGRRPDLVYRLYKKAVEQITKLDPRITCDEAVLFLRKYMV